MEEQYLIESMEHTHGQFKSWWRPNSLGYTRFIDEAGRYSKAEAEEICEKAGPENERMWLESQVLSRAGGKRVMSV